jgi:acyl carrier protein
VRRDEQLSRVAAALAKLRPELGSGVDPRARLAEDLGLESLEIVELLSLIEEEHDVPLDERRIGASPTVADVERLLQSPSETEARPVSMPRWTWSLLPRLVRGFLRAILLRPLFAVFVRLEVRGGEHLRHVRAPFLLVSNHTSVFDAPAVLFALPPWLRRRLAPSMAIETLPEHFDPEGQPLLLRIRSRVLYSLALLLFGAYPLPQSRGYRPSLEYTGELLDAGRCPLVFPEGAMTRSGAMTPFKAGIGLLAVETRALVVPVHVEGLGEILPPESRWPKRGRARVTFGPPFLASTARSDEPAEVASRIESAVSALKGS